MNTVGMGTEEFFKRILPASGVYYAVAATNNGMRHIPCSTIGELASTVQIIDARGDTAYFACTTYKQPHVEIDGRKRYRTPENQRSARAFWIDVDVGPDKAAQCKGYSNRQDAVEGLWQFCDQTGFPKPLLVQSGNGYHGYWPLDVDVPSDEWKATAEKFKRITEHFGLKADATRTADFASILRPPGTFNRKDPENPKAVQVIFEGEVIATADFVALVEKLFAAMPTTGVATVIGQMKTSDDALGAIPAWIAGEKSANTDLVAHTKLNPGPESERFVSAVMAVPADRANCDRKKYLNMIWAIKASGVHDAESHARAWCQLSPSDFNEADFSRDWESGDPDGPIGIGTVFMYAKQAGWLDPYDQSAQDRPTPEVTPVVQTLNDSGNADRFLAAYGEDLRYSIEDKCWLYWHLERWHPDDRRNVIAIAERVARRIFAEAQQYDIDIARRIAKHATDSLYVPRLEAMVAIAKGRPGVPLHVTELDADPWVAGTRNGVVDLKSGAFRRTRKDDLITKSMAADFEAQATCPVWARFVNSVMQGDPDLIGFLQRAIGYSVTGSTREQVFFFLYGIGANGKSTLVNTLRELFGGYSIQIQPEALMVAKSSNAGSATPHLVRMKGARFIAAVETEDGQRLSESLVKQLTGGDAITARPLYGEPFDFVPEGKFWISGNHKPIIYGSDHGIWRRIVLIPFNRIFKEEEQDKQLPEKLRAEFPGILNWIIEGVHQYQLHGLKVPARILREVATYRGDMDIIGQWIEEKCIQGQGEQVSGQEAYGSYTGWANDCGHPQFSNVRFAQKLAERGFQKFKTREGARYMGLRLKRPGEFRAEATPSPVFAGVTGCDGLLANTPNFFPNVLMENFSEKGLNPSQPVTPEPQEAKNTLLRSMP